MALALVECVLYGLQRQRPCSAVCEVARPAAREAGSRVGSRIRVRSCWGVRFSPVEHDASTYVCIAFYNNRTHYHYDFRLNNAGVRGGARGAVGRARAQYVPHAGAAATPRKPGNV